MSAKLEEADEQFESLRNSIISYKEEVKEIASAKNEIEISKKLELNLDSLQAFLDLHFPERLRNIEDTAQLVDSFLKFNISLSSLIKSYEIVKDYLDDIENETFEKDFIRTNRWSQTGVARTIMDLTNDNWRENRGIPFEIIESPRRWSKKILNSLK